MFWRFRFLTPRQKTNELREERVDKSARVTRRHIRDVLMQKLGYALATLKQHGRLRRRAGQMHCTAFAMVAGQCIGESTAHQAPLPVGVLFLCFCSLNERTIWLTWRSAYPSYSIPPDTTRFGHFPHLFFFYALLLDGLNKALVPRVIVIC